MKKLLKLSRRGFPVLKFDLKMKLTAWFALTTLFALQANESYGQKTKLSLDYQSIRVDNLIDKIETSTEFRFIFKMNAVELDRTVSISVQDETINRVLDKVFGGTKTAYRILNRRIYLTENKEGYSKVNSSVQKAINVQLTVTGTVTDENGSPMPGASIVEKGTANGTTTDFDGNFTLDISDQNAVLVVSYIGFESKQLTVGNENQLIVQLQLDASQLDEVVVIGYGTQEKTKFNGAVSKIRNEKLNQYSNSNFEQALVGNLPGVQVFDNGKSPGQDGTIQIRGINTLTAGTYPLIVVDGIPLTEGSSLSSINTRDIESLNVLKDAASASIYGSRAANGVILITTKKGTREGDVQITYDAYLGVNRKIDNFQLVDAYDAAVYLSEARNNSYISKNPSLHNITDDNATRLANGAGKRDLIPTYLQDYLNGVPGLTNTNWEDEVYRSAYQQNHYLNIKGGTKKTDFSISFGYLNQESIVIFSDFERFNNVTSINTKLSDKFKFGVNINTSLSNSNLTGTNAWTLLPADPGHGFILMYPYYPVYNDDGTYAISAQLNDMNNNWDGPISENQVVSADYTKNFERNFRVFGSTYVELEPIPRLKLKSSFGGDYRYIFSDVFTPSTIGNYRQTADNNPARSHQDNRRSENFIIENTADYSFALDRHNFNLLVGHSFQKESTFFTRVVGTDFIDDNIDNVSGATNFTVNNIRSQWALSSLFSRLQYGFDDKYFLSASYRRDGSSRFGSSTRYAPFVSYSGGWAFSEESFFPENRILNYGKFRLSWGQSGNNQIGDFRSLSLLEADNYNLNGALVSGIGIDSAPNDNLSWETSTSTNLGLDLGLFKNRFSITAEYYKTNTTDLLLDVPVPQQTGFSESLQNIGKLENTGFELDLRYNDIKIGKLGLGLNANLTTSNNEVKALAPNQKRIIRNDDWMDFLTEVGGPIAQLYSYDIMGVFKSQEEIDEATNSGVVPLSGTQVGDYIVRDVNGDGVITPDDRTTLGDYNSELVYGFGITLNYKGFDFSAQFDGIEGRKLFDRMFRLLESGDGFMIPTQYYFDNYFHPTRNPDGFFAEPNFNQSASRRTTRASSINVLDADYFRLRSVQLGYSLPVELTQKFGISKMRIYFTGNNLFQISGYRGLYSDGIRNANVLSRGMNFNGTPISRFMALGFTLNF